MSDLDQIFGKSYLSVKNIDNDLDIDLDFEHDLDHDLDLDLDLWRCLFLSPLLLSSSPNFRTHLGRSHDHKNYPDLDPHLEIHLDLDLHLP